MKCNHNQRKPIRLFALFVLLAVFLYNTQAKADSNYQLIVKFWDESISWPEGDPEGCYSVSELKMNSEVEQILEKYNAVKLCKADPSVDRADSIFMMEGVAVPIPYLFFRYIIDFSIEGDRDNAIKDLSEYGNTAYAEEIIPREDLSMETNDTWFFDSWHLRNPWDHDLDADEAWQDLLSQYPNQLWTSNVVLGDVETGFNYSHPDADDARVHSPEGSNSHHMACMSIIGAMQTNNNIGVAGLHWAAQVYGRENCTQMISIPGMRAFSTPWNGGWGMSYTIDIAASATMHSQLWAASTGNSYDPDPENREPVPAWDRGNLGCTSYNASGDWGGWPDAGEHVDIAAPGEEIWIAHNVSAVDRLCYNVENRGTSWSGPMVVGAAGILIDQGQLRNPPLTLTSEDVTQIMELTAEDANSAGYDIYSGWGNLNVWYAQRCVRDNPIQHNTRTSSQLTPSSDLVAQDITIQFGGVPWTGAGSLTGSHRADIYRISYPVTFLPSLIGTPAAWGNAWDTWGLDTIEVVANSSNVNYVPTRMATYLNANTLSQSGATFYTFQYRLRDSQGNLTNDYAPGYIEDLRVFYTVLDIIEPQPPIITVSGDAQARQIVITPNRVTGTATSYLIERSIDRINWTTIAANHVGLTYLDQTTLPNVKSYWYRVSGRNNLGGGIIGLPSGERSVAVNHLTTTNLPAYGSGHTRQIVEDKSRAQHVVYEDGGHIYYTFRLHVEATPNYLPDVDISGANCTKPSIATWDTLNPSRVFVSWISSNNGVQVREIQRFNLGNTATLAMPGGTLSAPTVVASNSRPTLFVGLSNGSSSDMGLYYWTRDENGNWTNCTRVPGSESFPVTSVSAFCLNELPQDLFVVWSRPTFDPGNAIYYHHAHWNNGQWVWQGNSIRLNDEFRITCSVLNDMYPTVAVPTSGMPVVAWEGYDVTAGHYKVFTRHQTASGWSDIQEVYWQGCSENRYPVLGVRQARLCSTCPADTMILAIDWQPYNEANHYVRFFSQDNTSGAWVRSLQGRTEPIQKPSLSGFSIVEWENDNPVVRRDAQCYTGLMNETSPYTVVTDTYRSHALQGLPSDEYVETNATFTAPFVLDHNITLRNNATLTIVPGTCLNNSILCYPNKLITVEPGSELRILGTANNRISFHAVNSAESWQGFYVNGGKLEVNYSDFFDASPYTIYTNAPAGAAEPVKIDHCYFNGSKTPNGGIVLRLWNSPSLTQRVSNSTIENVPQGNGLYLYNCDVWFENDTIRDCDFVNSYIKKVTGHFNSCIFSGRASYYSVLFNTPSCTPNFTCCQFDNVGPLTGNWPSSLYCAGGTQPSFSYSSTLDPGFANDIEDNCPYLMIMENGGLLPITQPIGQGYDQVGGSNNWIQTDVNGYFFYWKNSGNFAYPCQSQYWDPQPPALSRFNPSNAVRWDYSNYLIYPAFNCSVPAEQSQPENGSDRPITDRTTGLDDQNIADLLSYALVLEDSGYYADAQPLYRSVATSTSDQYLRWTAVNHIITTASRLPLDDGWIVNLLDSLVEAENSEYGTYVLSRRLITSHYVNRQEYSNAIINCNTLFEHGLTFSDSIQVAIDLIGVQYAAGLITYDGSTLDAEMTSLVPFVLRVHSDIEGRVLEQNLLNLLGSDNTLPVSIELPTTYQLYQNYPNPFNPNTEIRFDLPEDIRIELKVFNTLGQLVTTLADEIRPAGAYTITWNGTSQNGAPVSSGLYIYQLKAGNFSDSKKMILLR